MPNICPVCFSDIGTPSFADFIWSDDPILATPTLSTAQYAGFTRMKAQHIKELQQNRNQLEINLGLTPTVFTPIDVTNLFQNWDKYILELRQSTETLLTAVGMTKETYFNYDKNGTDMNPGNHQLDWVDVVDLTNHNLCHFQSKGRHIEDLRHFIQTAWHEYWTDLILSDTVSVDVAVNPLGTYDTHLSTLTGDHLWRYNLEPTWGSFYARGWGTSGHATVSGILNCNGNYNFSGSAYVNANINFHTTGAMAYHKLTMNDGIKIITMSANANLIITNLLYNFTQSNPNPAQEPTPHMPTLIISIAGINYVFGDAYGVTHALFIQDTNFSGIFQRNLYNDYITVYGVPPTLTPIYEISLISQCPAFRITNGSGTTEQLSTMQVTLGHIDVRNVV